MKKILFFLFIFFSFRVDAETLHIETVDGLLKFKTDIANTPALQETGLMFKKSIPNNYTMTFLYDKPRLISMWMKNTYIPLDMVFFDEKGIVVRLVENARPHDLTPIYSVFKVKGVIEMNAGLIKKYNISVGDKITIQ